MKTDSSTQPAGGARALTAEEARDFTRTMHRLWATATDEAFCRSYLFEAHPHNLEIVTKYSDLLEERSAMLRQMAERYGRKAADPGTPPADLADMMTDLLGYFAHRDEGMITFLRAMYGITSPRALRKC